MPESKFICNICGAECDRPTEGLRRETESCAACGSSVRLRAGDPVTRSSSDLRVIISHEPWGEATINFPGIGSITSVEILNPQITASAIRFITPDVALADGACTYKDDGTTTQTTPLLFVLKREGDDWKIASLRLLVPR